MHEQAPELIELIQNELAGIDAQFQFWITITFAVVVASHFARGQLGPVVRISIAALYALAVLLLASRMGSHIQSAQYLASVLAGLGVDDPRFSAPPSAPLVGVLRWSLLVLGSLAAVVFILRGIPTAAGSRSSREDAV